MYSHFLVIQYQNVSALYSDMHQRIFLMTKYEDLVVLECCY